MHWPISFTVTSPVQYFLFEPAFKAYTTLIIGRFSYKAEIGEARNYNGENPNGVDGKIM